MMKKKKSILTEISKYFFITIIIVSSARIYEITKNPIRAALTLMGGALIVWAVDKQKISIFLMASGIILILGSFLN